MESTDFEVMFDESLSVDYNVEVLTAYINFCVDLIVPSKVVKCFGNNKPWVTKDLKGLLNQKKHLIAVKDRAQLKIVQKQIDRTISDCKEKHKAKVESMFRSDPRSAWKGIKQLTGMCKQKFKPDVDKPKMFCDDLNIFYSRFDKHDFSSARESMNCHLRRQTGHERVIITEDEVLNSLTSIKSGKAPGPDEIGTNVLKMCSRTLAPILCKIFQQSLDQVRIPQLWKTSEIVPVPKKVPTTCNNDFRPVALTAIMMKCLEKIIKKLLQAQVAKYTDPCQFAYRSKRCVDDATLSLIDYVLEHVDRANTGTHKYFAKILFVDFSSAFNTIQPHIMTRKLNDMNVHPSLILWINEFLTERPQYVKFLGSKSDMLYTNTGAPQGCVLSPMLFTLYTSDCRTIKNGCKLFKYADDTALVGRCINNDALYRTEVARFTTWCEENFLELNVKKTKEMVVDFRKNVVEHEPLYIANELVENVTEYKYLGTTLDNTFTFATNTSTLHKKVQSRVYFVRQLRKLNVSQKILDLMYTSIISSVLSFSITCWYGNCSSEAQCKLDRVVNQCSRLGVQGAQSLNELYWKSVKIRCEVIQKDKSHPLNFRYEKLRSGKRLRSMRCRTARYGKSFVPSSIRMLNE